MSEEQKKHKLPPSPPDVPGYTLLTDSGSDSIVVFLPLLLIPLILLVIGVL